jgi:peptide/nickel transport system ATP-binding protein
VSGGAAAVLTVDGLSVDYVVDRRIVRAVDGVAFEIRGGETVALVGESGSGKSSVALAIMGLLDPPRARVSGQIRMGGRDLVALPERELEQVRGRDVAIVFQDTTGALNPVCRVGEQLVETIVIHDRAGGRDAATTRAGELLERLGLTTPEAVLRAYPHELSGGMRQRVGLALALVNDPRLLIADEATTALDATTQAEVLDLLRQRQEATGMAMLVVTHDLGVVAAMAHHVVVLYAGRVVEAGTVEEVLGRPRHPYTLGLLESVPHLERARGPLSALPGAPPRAGAEVAGCRFAPRCWLADVECLVVDPALRSVGGSHQAACLRLAEVPSLVRWRS